MNYKKVLSLLLLNHLLSTLCFAEGVSNSNNWEVGVNLGTGKSRIKFSEKTYLGGTEISSDHKVNIDANANPYNIDLFLRKYFRIGKKALWYPEAQLSYCGNNIIRKSNGDVSLLNTDDITISETYGATIGVGALYNFNDDFSLDEGFYLGLSIGAKIANAKVSSTIDDESEDHAPAFTKEYSSIVFGGACSLFFRYDLEENFNIYIGVNGSYTPSQNIKNISQLHNHQLIEKKARKFRSLNTNWFVGLGFNF